MSYLISIPLSLAIEVPILTIEKILFGGFGRGEERKEKGPTAIDGQRPTQNQSVTTASEAQTAEH